LLPFVKLSSLLSAILFCLLFWQCNKPDKTHTSRKVYIRKADGRYTIIRNGKPFKLKGGGGYSHFSDLRNAGGNTMRTWDTTHLDRILDSARANGIAIIAGLPLPNSNDSKFYNDPAVVNARQERFQTLIRKYRSHPALLMWCLGNELDFPYKLTYKRFYESFNALTDMIHREDPDHPVTTTILNFNQKYIFNIRLRCDIDVISFNVFNSLHAFRKDLTGFAWFWSGPYMLLEWGINGPWQGSDYTAWGAYIEDTSTKKAEIYKNRYRIEMPLEDPRYLGSCVFFWGHKQETTHTWFSIFDETGGASETLATMQYLWTGTTSKVRYPDVKYMLLNKKGAKDNIMLNPATTASAEVLMSSDIKDIKSIKWQVFREDWYRENNKNSTARLVPLITSTGSASSMKITFTSPREEGPYRIFATIYDHSGNFASCNTPFYIVGIP
jgi:hypothetical protein